MNNYGISDIANDKDDFDISESISGFTEFVQHCSTPMTIAIQGEWGSGKTTLMNIVMKNLNAQANVKTLFLNMWQYSQFSCQDDLPIIMLQEFSSLISLDNKSRKNKAPELVKAIAMTGVDSVLGGRMGVHAGQVIDELYRVLGIDIGSNALPVLLKRLKSEVQKGIDEFLEAEGKERIVVFIDDLDRINSEKALQLLESIKNYLDCAHCVFVIAVDYYAVVEGAKAFYRLSAAKSKQYFDKIIQVNYQMPVSKYSLESYINESINTLAAEQGIELGRYKDDFLSMVICATNGNPRAIKRLLNCLSLYFLTNKALNNNEYTNTILCALVCMQVFYDSLYRDVAHNLQYNRFNVVRQILNTYERLRDHDSEVDREKTASIMSISIDQVDSFLEFCHIFVSILKNGRELYDQKLKFLKQLVISTSTVDIKYHFGISKMYAFDLMNSISFCAGQGIDPNTFSALSRWKNNSRSIGLPVSIGIDTMGNDVSIDINDSKFGPNGLIGGASGSGKSAFLTTYILGLVTSYSYNRVKLILINFRRGGTFEAFSKIPHTLSVITNEKEMVSCLDWLNEEINRRELLLKKVGANNTAEYSELRLENKAVEPVPEIVIIIDEMAFIKIEHPELFRRLLSYVDTTVEHSLGVHLVLATQRPSGLIDHYTFSLCNFKIGFSQSREDSYDLLKSDIANTLSRPGEAVLLTQGQYKIFQVYHAYESVTCRDGTTKSELMCLLESIERDYKV